MAPTEGDERGSRPAGVDPDTDDTTFPPIQRLEARPSTEPSRELGYVTVFLFRKTLDGSEDVMDEGITRSQPPRQSSTSPSPNTRPLASPVKRFRPSSGDTIESLYIPRPPAQVDTGRLITKTGFRTWYLRLDPLGSPTRDRPMTRSTPEPYKRSETLKRRRTVGFGSTVRRQIRPPETESLLRTSRDKERS